MKREQLEHVLRAAAGVTGADRIVVIGSQAVLGQFPNAPADLLVSIEADLFTLRSPADAELIEGSIGEGSPFHRTFGYYAHGVGEETAVLPVGWKDRLVAVTAPSMGGATGLCLDVHDLAVSKLVAGREKDLSYVCSLLRNGMVNAPTLEQRIAGTPTDAHARERCLRTLDTLARRIGR